VRYPTIKSNVGKKTIRASLYTKCKIKWTRGKLFVEEDPNGYLYSGGRYRTKLLPQDLPEWYVCGYMYKQHGYMSAKGVCHLSYVPNYTFDNHMHKYDMLYISYNEPIMPYESCLGFTHYKGYDHLLSGPVLVEFVNAVGKFSNYNVDSILYEIKHKQDFYYERNKNKAI